MFRRVSALVMCCALFATAAASATAATPEVPDTMTGWGILVPGQSGEPLSPHRDDQRLTYAALVDDDDVTEEELGDYFHPLQFGSPDIEREYNPPGRTDVTIYRDTLGVPQIYGDTDTAMAFGFGYATAEDRLWQMDVLRHASKGEIADFLSDPDLLGADKIARRDGYTPKQVTKMFESFADHGEQGQLLQEMLVAYVDGVNARAEEARTNPLARPGEYLITQNDIVDWTVNDVLEVQVLQTRNFGGDGGDEVERVKELRLLQDQHGAATGRAIFDDLLFLNDPASYTTIPAEEGTFDSPLFGAPNNKAIAKPDNVKALAAKMARQQAASGRVVERLNLPKLASNGIVVAGSNTASGDPIHYGAPQVGYNSPSFLYEVEGHSPNFDFSGVTVAGGGPAIVLGRTAHLAWMIPVGVGDMMDERAEKLCNPKGKKKKVKKGSKYYLFKGKCRKMKGRTEQIVDPATGDNVAYKVFRTVHGPVVARATVNGKPVAISQERTTWMHEPDFALAAGIWSMNSTDSVEDFAAGVEIFPMSFNILYADSTNTAYFYGGRHAIRAEGVDPRFPSWGTGKYEWQRFMNEDERPHMIDPDQGWFVNWNNKPSVGWDGTASGNWGAAHRVGLLATGMEAQGEGFTMSDVVDVARNAATQDSNAVQLWEFLSPELSPATPAETAALAALEEWVDGGAHRTDADRDLDQDHATAVAAWDTMLRDLIARVFTDEIGDLSEPTGIRLTDDASTSNGSSYFFSYVDYLLNMVSGETGIYSRNYCDDIGTGAVETCAQQAQAAFAQAIADLAAEQGDDPAAWTWAADYIEFGTFGASSNSPIPWQNRGTWNHIVELHG